MIHEGEFRESDEASNHRIDGTRAPAMPLNCGVDILDESGLTVGLVAYRVYTQHAVMGERHTAAPEWVAVGALYAAVGGEPEMDDAGLSVAHAL